MEIDKMNSQMDLCKSILQSVMDNFLVPLHKFAVKHPQYISRIPGFLLRPRTIKIYVGRSHVGVEYLGEEIIEQLPEEGGYEVEIYFHDVSLKEKNLLEEIIGFDCESDTTAKVQLPLSGVIENGLFFTNRGFDRLIELGWNFAARESMVAFNAFPPLLEPHEFVRIINTSFFNSEDEVGLQTRHIKWLDAIPIKFDSSNDEYDLFEIPFKLLSDSLQHAGTYSYPIPEGYKKSKLEKVNRFIEFWGDMTKSETDVTSFLANSANDFILTMRFCCQRVYPELDCIWQSEKRKNIRPDFFSLNTNGYADIVEFKKPFITKNVIVGSENRETFSSWMHSYVAQTRVYSEYFDDPNNRKWFEKKYGFKVYKPRRWLVVGRRSDFPKDVWHSVVSEFPSVSVITYDDLVDGVVAQLYK